MRLIAKDAMAYFGTVSQIRNLKSSSIHYLGLHISETTSNHGTPVDLWHDRQDVPP